MRVVWGRRGSNTGIGVHGCVGQKRKREHDGVICAVQTQLTQREHDGAAAVVPGMAARLCPAHPVFEVVHAMQYVWGMVALI